MNQVKSIPSVIHLGPFIYDERFGYNAYLIIDKPYIILIDLSPIQVIESLLEAIKKHVSISELTHLVLQYKSISHYDALTSFIHQGFNGDIITSSFIARQLKKSSFNNHVYAVDEIGHKLIYKNTQIFQFIPIGFLPLPEMFCTYFPKLNALFSSTLFGSFYVQESNPEMDLIKKSLFSFHQYMMPSSEFIKAPLEVIKKLKIDAIYPVLGYHFHHPFLSDILDFEQRLDFYNTRRVISYKDQNLDEINYDDMINQMLNKLQNHYPRIEILDVFVGSHISIHPDPLEIKRSTLSGYKLWNGFFEIINAKKGLNWLMTLEPLINKYYSDYGIDKPSIYRSMIVEMTSAKASLEKQKDDLTLEVEKLHETVTVAKEMLLRCPITKLYNQEMFKQIITQDIQKMSGSPQNYHFILVQLDQLFSINQKYGKSLGDESLRHFAYLIEQVKKDQTQVFKQNGPGFLIYMPESPFTSILACANTLKNNVADSNLFIEKVSCSVAVVSFDEIDNSISENQKISHILALLDKRMNHAKRLGYSEIVDRTIDIPKPKDGLILLVDEDPISQNMIYRIFNRINYDVKIAKDVNEALLFVEQYAIDIVISEINLSKIDGFSLKRQLNESKAYSKIPFIMVSHNKTLENIRRGNILDVDLILEKPIIPDELIGHVKRFKERK